ncbi:MAG: ribonuclease Z [Armatimonadaceae bacterium]
MELTFLGTGSGAPTRARNVSAVALQLPQRSEWWLVDCGEATQHQILRCQHLRLSNLTRIFITHLHGDHCFGLPGLLASRALALGGTSPVSIHGPEALEPWLKATLRATAMRFGFPVNIEATQAGMLFDDGGFFVSAAPVRHRIEAWAYRIQEHDQPGRFDIESARALGIPEGPLYGRLKRGETVTLDDGRVVDGSSLVGPERPGRGVVFGGDTAWSQELLSLARKADLLVHEATYSNDDRVLAERASHSTALSAAKLARGAQVREMLLTHFSSRYEGNGERSVDDLVDEARTVFGNTRAAHDFLRVTVERFEPDAEGPESADVADSIDLPS